MAYGSLLVDVVGSDPGDRKIGKESQQMLLG